MQRKTVLITGASGGIGQALAKIFCQAGYDLCLHYFKSEEKIKSLVQELEALKEENQKIVLLRLDLSLEHQGQNLVEESIKLLGRPLSVILFNAGVAEMAPLQDLTLERYQTLHRLFLENPLFACQRLLPEFLSQGEGKIIFISSIWGLCGASCEVAYSSLKAAQHGLVKALAQEWGPSQVSVYAIACGMIDTEMNAALSIEEKQALCEQIPLGRFGKPEEIARLALFLASSDANYLTGQILSPNGAFYC